MTTIPLRNELTRYRATVFQDPPGLASIEDINKVADWAFEGVVEQARNFKNSDPRVKAGCVFVYQNEHRNLSFLNTTCLIKSIVQFQQRMESVDHLPTREAEITELSDVAGTIYPSFISDPDYAKLLDGINELASENKNVVKENVSTCILEKISRIAKHYALVQNAALEWLRVNNFNLEVDAKKAIQEYFVDVCLPNVVQLLLKNNKEDIPNEDCLELENILANSIRSLQWKDVTSSFEFSRRGPQPTVAIALCLWDLPSLANSSNSIAVCQTKEIFQGCTPKRRRFLPQNSEVEWCRKSNDQENIKNLRKLLAYVIPQRELPEQIFDALIHVISSKVPSVANADRATTWIGRKIDEHFFPSKKANKEESTQSSSNCMEKIKRRLEGLAEDDLPEVLALLEAFNDKKISGKTLRVDHDKELGVCAQQMSLNHPGQESDSTSSSGQDPAGLNTICHGSKRPSNETNREDQNSKRRKQSKKPCCM